VISFLLYAARSLHDAILKSVACCEGDSLHFLIHAGLGVKFHLERVSVMRLVRSAVVSILRPIYKLFLEGPLWWFLAKVKAFFLAEIGPQLDSMGRRLTEVEERLTSTEANNAAQWSALEELLLALYRQTEVRIDSDGRCSAERDDPSSSAAGQDRTHEQNNIR